MTKSAAPLPKLRVTYSSRGEAAPQCALERDARDDAFDFAGLGVARALRDLPREDDVLEVED